MFMLLQGRSPSRRLILVCVSFFCILLTLLPASSVSAHAASSALVGPKEHYLALGDSLAFGYQPDLDFSHGYTAAFYSDLQTHGVTSSANMSCPGETSVTFVNGTCPVPILRKFPYLGSQLNAAVAYLDLFKGQVSPVTLDIGANDVLPDINKSTCVVDMVAFNRDLATVDSNLTQIILPKLHAALTDNGVVTGDLAVMNYYNAYQNSCPNTTPLVQLVNRHIAQDVSGYGTVVDVFSAFGGSTTPNPNICSYSWICSIFKDIHAKDRGYSLIASTFESTLGY